MMKLAVAFCNFAKAPNKDCIFMGYGTVSRASGTDVLKNSIAFFFFFFLFKGKAVERECLPLKHCKKLVSPLRSFAMTLPQRTLSQKKNFIACLSVPAHTPYLRMHMECVGPHYGPPVMWQLTTVVPLCATSIPFIIHPAATVKWQSLRL